MKTEPACRYLEKVPGIRSGKAIVSGTRLGVQDIAGLVIISANADDVVRSFPDITRAHVYECLACSEDHRPEVDFLVAEQMPPAPE